MTQELIAKLESASKGSRELNVALWDRFGGWAGVTHPPAYTTSIDAALALAERVLPGWGVNLFNGDPCHGDNRYCKARLWSNDNPPQGTGFDGNSKTLPLAICAALLRASAAEGAGE